MKFPKFLSKVIQSEKCCAYEINLIKNFEVIDAKEEETALNWSCKYGFINPNFMLGIYVLGVLFGLIFGKSFCSGDGTSILLFFKHER